MDEGCLRAIAEEGPWAEVVLERFHVARAYRHGADTVRQKELQRRKRARPTAADAALPGARWPFRQPPADLKPEEWERLERVFTGSPTIEAASTLRADLTERCERHDTNAGATCAVRAWGTRVRESGRAEGESFLGTRDRGMDEITNDFQGRQTRGFVEGFTTRVKVLKRRCDGIFALGKLFPRLTLDWHGDHLFGHP